MGLPPSWAHPLASPHPVPILWPHPTSAPPPVVRLSSPPEVSFLQAAAQAVHPLHSHRTRLPVPGGALIRSLSLARSPVAMQQTTHGAVQFAAYEELKLRVASLPPTTLDITQLLRPAHTPSSPSPAPSSGEAPDSSGCSPALLRVVVERVVQQPFHRLLVWCFTPVTTSQHKVPVWAVLGAPHGSVGGGVRAWDLAAGWAWDRVCACIVGLVGLGWAWTDAHVCPASQRGPPTRDATPGQARSGSRHAAASCPSVCDGMLGARPCHHPGAVGGVKVARLGHAVTRPP